MSKPVTPQDMFDLWQKMMNPGAFPMQNLMFPMLDLKEVARRLLERAGVTAVEDSGICTRCEGETFFSHRGEGPETGRQAGIVTAA